MRDAAGQMSHRLELLGVAQLRLQVLPVGDVAHEKVHRRFAVVHDRGRRGLSAEGFSVEPLEVEFYDRKLPDLPGRPLQFGEKELP